MRKNAKCFDELPPNIIKAYHKCHISKTMGIAVVGFAFEDSIENGGIALKMVLHRAQSAKVAQKLTRNKNGNVIRRKGDIFHVDCCVTGSNEGDSKTPKFPLILLFLHLIFPQITRLTGPDAQFCGYTPVIQGDSAGPHIDGKFYKYVTDYCKERGWLWEPQGPQMPHINVLDLAVFPAMSRRHCHKARALHGTRVLTEDEIWEQALSVWNELPSSKIANAFVLAKRFAEKIIATKGGNNFLTGHDGLIHSGVRADFIDTEDGNVRRDIKTIPFIERKEAAG